MVHLGEHIASAGDGAFSAVTSVGTLVFNAYRWNDHHLGPIEYAPTCDIWERPQHRGPAI